MNLANQFGRQLLVGLVLLTLFALAAYVLVSFIAVIVLAIFLYYAVRPIFRLVNRTRLPRRVSAALSVILFGLPFLVLVAYAVTVVALEVRLFLEEQGLFEDLLTYLESEFAIGGLDAGELEDLATASGELPPPEVILEMAVAAASTVGSVLVQVLVIVVTVYYMLVDGPRLMGWLFETYDESGVLRAYARAVDPELSLTLFGNIVNVFITAVVGIFTFYTFNFFAPEVVQIPFPALLGALAGIGSLIPVVGIKLVYIPLTIGLAVNAWLTGVPEAILPVVALFVVSAVIVDFIPDFFIRAQISGENTHTGLLMLAYIVGPTVFGFYGLFLAPILLVATINAVAILLPYALVGEYPETTQARLDAFEQRE